MLQKTTRKEGKVLQGKDHVRRKCDVKKSRAPMFRSFILSLGLKPLKKYVHETTGMPKLKQTLEYNSSDIVFLYSELLHYF